VTVLCTFITETITTPAEVALTEGPDGVLVAGRLFKAPAYSRGAVRSTPANCQITAVPERPLLLGVIVRAVAPARLFAAYQM
jgi:hypothetical protein